MWIWPPIIVLVTVCYMVAYVLLRTSGDGRPALQRLLHPTKGGLQEEYGGDGTGQPLEGYRSSGEADHPDHADQPEAIASPGATRSAGSGN